jgi:hypothetical protein
MISSSKRIPSESQIAFVTSEVKKGSSKSSIIRTMYITMTKENYEASHRMGDIMRALDSVYATATKFQQVRNVLVSAKLR